MKKKKTSPLEENKSTETVNIEKSEPTAADKSVEAIEITEAPRPEPKPAPAEPEKPTIDSHSFIPKLFTVTSSPHVRTDDTSRSIMVDVCIALMPALIWGIYVFGWRVLTIALISVVFAVGSEYLYEKLMKKPITILDFSAVVTGILLAMNLPVAVPLWMPAVGAVFAIIVVKQLFGGIGKNFVNPALAARVFLFAWPAHMSAFTKPGEWLSAISISAPNIDAVATATPLAALKNGAMPDTSLFDMIIGYEGGCIGEVSALLLTAGFIYLLVRKVITWKIPVCYIGTVLILTFLFAQNSLKIDFSFAEIFSGGLFLGAIFMATDYSTSPLTEIGRIIYGIGCGLLTVFIRYFGGYPEGVSFSILIMNLLVWYIDRYTKPVKFGGAGLEKAKKQ
ncbi:MAG: RnfABCDGE type electron transport complex subunit D [Clostridiales bacterium]|nr:RnfABCDGE type electron transport complex subunit D [Clostridiales bacterium]